MRYFTYVFHLNTFYKKYLLKSNILFFFHLLCRYNLNNVNLLFRLFSLLKQYWSVFAFNNLFYFFGYFCKYSFILFFIICMLILFKLRIELDSFRYFFLVYLIGWCNKCLFQYQLFNIYFNNVYCISKLFFSILNLKKNNFIFCLKTVNKIKRKLYTILKSPHVHKKARDQYLHVIFKQSIKLINLPFKYNIFSLFFLQLSSKISYKITNFQYLF